MYWLKACPRCGGDLRDEQDHYGPYVACVQCGYILPTQVEQTLRATGTVERERATPARRAA